MPARAGRRALVAVVALVAVALAGCGGASSPDGSPTAASSVAASSAAPSANGSSNADLAACPPPGDPATGDKLLPDVALPCLAGGEVALRQLTGVPTVLNFWAAWCKPCREEMPVLAAFAKQAGGAVRVIGVDTAESPKSGAAFLAREGIDYPSLSNEDSSVLHSLGLTGLPATVLLRADGSIAAVHPQPIDADELRALAAREFGVHVDG